MYYVMGFQILKWMEGHVFSWLDNELGLYFHGLDVFRTKKKKQRLPENDKDESVLSICLFQVILWNAMLRFTDATLI